MKKSKEKKEKNIQNPQLIQSYFKAEWFPLLFVVIGGIIYNIGLTAGPYFEGQLAQRLFEIMNGQKKLSDMISLVIIYLTVILIVQGARVFKRFFVRRFANDTSKNMRHIIYRTLVWQNRNHLCEEEVGKVMTQAIFDVDACAEGMRKFATEIFDTGVVLISLFVMLLIYDWRLACISCAFSPLAYIIAEALKKYVIKFNSDYKKSADALNGFTLDRVSNAITYRVYGCEAQRKEDYEQTLNDYEHKAVKANIWENTPQPLYNIIAMTGVIFIVYFGGKNLSNTGWTAWDIAAFTTFLSCFAKLALRSSKVAKLFNSIQKAKVSWQRIKPLMKENVEPDLSTILDLNAPVSLCVSNLGVSYDNAPPLWTALSFKAKSGEIIGITGPVASGKSTLGKTFLGEIAYEGTIQINGINLPALTEYEQTLLISYMGHQCELLNGSIEENVCLGTSLDCNPFLDAVCLRDEIESFPEGTQTEIGSFGVRLSGGQQARLALARTLCHSGKILILDDPFSAVDYQTEEEIFAHLKELSKDKIILLISHRLHLFPQLSKVICLGNSSFMMGTHDELCNTCETYQRLYATQGRKEVSDETSI